MRVKEARFCVHGRSDLEKKKPVKTAGLTG